MGGNLTGLIELFVVLLFGIGWGVIELVALRLDRQKAERERAAAEQRGKTTSTDAAD